MRTTPWALRLIDGDGLHGLEVKIDDEGAGFFVTVVDLEGDTVLRINPEEWPALRAAINRMFKIIEKEEGK